MSFPLNQTKLVSDSAQKRSSQVLFRPSYNAGKTTCRWLFSASQRKDMVWLGASVACKVFHVEQIFTVLQS